MCHWYMDVGLQETTWAQMVGRAEKCQEWGQSMSSAEQDRQDQQRRVKTRDWKRKKRK